MVSCRQEPSRGNHLSQPAKFVRNTIDLDYGLGLVSQSKQPFVSLTAASFHRRGSLLGGGAFAEVYLPDAISVTD